MRIMTATLILTCLALTASAQTVTVGSLKQIHGILYVFTPPYTLIDASHPANADGTVTSAAVAWGGGSCTAAFKLKFLRPTNTTSLTNYSLVGERGPFNAVAGRNQLLLTPPVDLKKGDLIAVTSLFPTPLVEAQPRRPTPGLSCWKRRVTCRPEPSDLTAPTTAASR